MELTRSQGPDIGRAAAIVLRRWKIVALAVLVTVGAASAWVFSSAKVFEAQALVTYQAPSQAENPAGSYLPSSGNSETDIQTLRSLANSNDLMTTVAHRAGLRDAAALRDHSSVEAQGNSQVLAFTGRASTSERAAKIADTYAKTFVDNQIRGARSSIQPDITAKKAELLPLRNLKVDDPNLTTRSVLMQDLGKLQRQLRQLTSSIRVSNPAVAPENPVWPKPLLSIFAATLLGLGFGCGLALLTARVDQTLRADLIDSLPMPVLVKVPMSTQAPKGRPLGPSLAEPLVADAFAALGARLMLDATGEEAHVTLVSSARSSEGKSSVASNLAASLAQGGRRVILLDADMRQPTQDIIFPVLQGRPGLSQLLLGTAQIEETLTLVAPNLAAIASGPPQQNASSLLASLAFRALIDRLSHICEAVIIDAPPVLPVTDALAIAPSAAQILVCARMGMSDIDELNETCEKLTGAASTPQAMVIIGTERPSGYGYTPGKERAAKVRPGAMPTAFPQAPNQAPPPPPTVSSGQAVV